MLATSSMESVLVPRSAPGFHSVASPVTVFEVRVAISVPFALRQMQIANHWAGIASIDSVQLWATVLVRILDPLAAHRERHAPGVLLWAAVVVGVVVVVLVLVVALVVDDDVVVVVVAVVEICF